MVINGSDKSPSVMIQKDSWGNKILSINNIVFSHYLGKKIVSELGYF